ncbi:MAG: FAD/NAD(P)-binding oxidoreductase [Nocardioides sp.]|uniref:NAD(P)/FAD-dependent oxidoreductase n=1 Tax=Nocardioides sp. TaxID=35761 RepID=UPI00326713D5
MRRIVVVGGSLAGHRAALALRGLGYDGRLTVIGTEPHRPYDRFPLSKGFLTRQTDRAGLAIDGAPADVVWHLDETATGLDLAGRRVIVGDRRALRFDGLVVASGARPRDVVLVQGALGAFVLRTVEDADGFRADLEARPRHVVVVGGGLIGAEVAAYAVARGHHTTMVEPSDLPTVKAVGRPVAEHLLRLHRAAGVHVRRRTRMRDLDVRAGAVTGVVLEDGSRLPADVVMMATGTTPNVDWLRGSGLAISGGLQCGPTLHARGSDRVVGAGDVIRVPQALLGGESPRVEHWASTLAHADLAAANLLAGPGKGLPLSALPTFGTTIHGARIRAVGFPQVADRSRVLWGSVEAGRALVALGRGSQIVAVVSLDAHERLEPLVGQLRPGSSLDDLRTVSGVLR